MESQFYERKAGFSQSYLLSRIVRNAQRPTKVPFFIREIRFNPLRWTEPFSVILQIAGPARVPTSRYLEEFSLALWFPGAPQYGGCSRPTASGAVLPPGAALQRYCGCRYHSADHLRFSRRYGGGLHSQETPWPSFLRSHHLQRRAPRFELGHGTQSRQCPRLLGSLGFSESGLGQTPFLGGVHAHAGTARWSFLRQKHRPVPRRKAAGIRCCRPHVPTVEKPHGRSSIPGVRSRMGSRAVLLHSPQVEARTPVCGRAQTDSFGNRRDPATALHFQAVHVPSSARHKSGADSTSRLAFLLRPGISGAFAAAVQGLLCHGQDPDPQLLGQCHLHGIGPVGLRPGPGLSISLPAQRGAALEHLHFAARALVVARRMGQAGQSQLSDAARKVSSAGSLPENSAGYLEGQNNCLHRCVTFLTASSLAGG